MNIMCTYKTQAIYKNAQLCAAFFIFMVALFVGSPAYAQCENAGSATAALNNLIAQDTLNINNFVQQETNFIDTDLDTATDEVTERLTEFDENIRTWLEDWWVDDFTPALQDATAQLGVAQVDQGRAAGSFMDAQVQAETQRELQEQQLESKRNFRPSELNAQWDSLAPGLGTSDEISRHLGKGINNDLAPREAIKAGTISEFGGSHELSMLWDEYLNYFCDPNANAGMAGCTVPGVIPGGDIKPGEMLWGERPTIDMSVPENQVLVKTMLRNLVKMKSGEPVLQEVLDTATGQQGMIVRRAQLARRQAIYNIMGALFGLRSNTQPDPGVAQVRQAAGVDVLNTSGAPSYRERMEALGRDKWRHPEMISRLIEEPETLLRIEGNMQAFHLQQLNDIYKRVEEMALLLASEYAQELDTMHFDTKVDFKAVAK